MICQANHTQCGGETTARNEKFYDDNSKSYQQGRVGDHLLGAHQLAVDHPLQQRLLQRL
jgi:hypothetical protein